MLDTIIASVRANGPAADTLIAEGFRARRYAGSGDRRAIRNLVYRAIRRFGEVPPSGRSALVALADEDPALAATFDGSPYGPATIDAHEARSRGGTMPPWLTTLIGDDPALLARAPFDLRANALLTTRDAVIASLPGATPIAGTPHGLRLPDALPLPPDGRVEVQDAGSQMVVAACRAQPGMTVVDLCAGAGGKTLALAADMANDGQLVACDTDRARLQRLRPRATLAQAVVAMRLLDGGREAAQLSDLSADVVLVDAPCTGSGTLRRNPEARWRLTPDRLARSIALQAHVLDLAAPLVKPGGALVYAVCSLIAAEGADAIAAFLARHRGFVAEPPFAQGRPSGAGRLLHPTHEGTDGFFVARLIRT